MIERVGIVFSKEVLDNLRDRRTVLVALLLPLLIGPGLFGALLLLIGRVAAEEATRTLDLPVAGAEHAPALVSFLEQNRVRVRAAPADAQAAVQRGAQDVVLEIPPDFEGEFRAGRPATVRLVFDSSRGPARPAIGRVQGLLDTYSRQIGTLRLLARGVGPSAEQTLAIEWVDLSTPEGEAANLLTLMPYFIIVTVFIGGMYVAIDTTAGERERGSLEPLVINPVARSELVLGKLGATLLFTVIGVVETLVGFLAVVNLLPVEGLGVPLRLAPLTLLGLLPIVAPIAFLASVLQVTIGIATRSFREAQNYLGLLTTLPAMPGLVAAVLPIRMDLWMMLIPVFGQQLLMNQMLRGERPEPVFVAVSALATLAAGAALTAAVARLFERERVVTRR